MKSLTVALAIGKDEMLRLYNGSARDVIAVAESGQTVRFPASILRPYVTHDGVHGRFRISFSDSGKFSRIEPVGNQPGPA